MTIIRTLGVWGVPVIVIHVALFNVLIKAWTGVSLGQLLPDRLIPWLWINGAMLAAGAWAWRTGRVRMDGRWLHGKRARVAVATWIGGSLFWFLLPSITQSIVNWLWQPALAW